MFIVILLLILSEKCFSKVNQYSYQNQFQKTQQFYDEDKEIINNAKFFCKQNHNRKIYVYKENPNKAVFCKDLQRNPTTTGVRSCPESLVFHPFGDFCITEQEYELLTNAHDKCEENQDRKIYVNNKNLGEAVFCIDLKLNLTTARMRSCDKPLVFNILEDYCVPKDEGLCLFEAVENCKNKSEQSKNKLKQSKNKSKQFKNKSKQSKNKSKQFKNKSKQSKNKSKQSKNKSEKFISACENNQYYYQCNNDKPDIFYCPNGAHWNATINLCENNPGVSGYSFTGSKCEDKFSNRSEIQIFKNKKLSYNVLNSSGSISLQNLRTAARTVFNEISSFTNLKFTKVNSNQNSDLTIMSKDLNETKLGEANLPPVGNIYLNTNDLFYRENEKKLEILNKTNVVSVLKHEIGHALGLQHKREPNSVMYPCSNVLSWSIDDIAELQKHYGSKGIKYEKHYTNEELMEFKHKKKKFCSKTKGSQLNGNCQTLNKN